MASRESIADLFTKCSEFTAPRQAREEGWYPYFRPIEATHGTRVHIQGRELIMAGSNNYQGLAYDERLRIAAKRAIDQHGTSCSGSRFMNGSLNLHEELETRLAAFTGKEAALVFTTGYQANLGAISALLDRDTHIVSDKLNHASIMDGIFLATGMNHDVNLHRYKHNDMEHLEHVLAELPEDEARLIVTDGVFSMEGDIVRLPELMEIARRYGARVYLDEAHAVGVIGHGGRGTVEYWVDNGAECSPDLVMCTFSKSFGSIGGFVAGDDVVIDYIRHHARSLIFSASMPPAQIGAAIEALRIMEEEPWRAKRLQEIGRKMIDGFRSLGFDVGTTETPIVPIVIGDNQKTFLFWKALFERGIYVNPVISPAVPPNRALLRTSYMAIHTDEELDRVLEIAGEEGRRLELIS